MVALFGQPATSLTQGYRAAFRPEANVRFPPIPAASDLMSAFDPLRALVCRVTPCLSCLQRHLPMNLPAKTTIPEMVLLAGPPAWRFSPMRCSPSPSLCRWLR